MTKDDMQLLYQAAAILDDYAKECTKPRRKQDCIELSVRLLLMVDKLRLGMTKMHITTKTDKHVISTVWIEVLGMYETMVFDHDEKGQSWKDIVCRRTKHRDVALVHHLTLVRRYAKNA